jgi:hypothetical protein
MLQDEDNKFAALITTHLTSKLSQFWEFFNARVDTLFEKEFVYNKLRCPKYNYNAIHYHWYNRYAEDVSWLSPFSTTL